MRPTEIGMKLGVEGKGYNMTRVNSFGLSRRACLLHGAHAAYVIALLLAMCLCGCSTFNRDWRRASVRAASENSVEGRWEGRWISEANGHQGKLRCLMIRQSDTRYHARFRATYGGAFHFTYLVPLEMEPHDGGWEFNGEANLGKLAGGVYYYEGRATGTNLISTYRSKYDHGRFELERPRGGKNR
jgi:hypothetical protein